MGGEIGLEDAERPSFSTQMKSELLLPHLVSSNLYKIPSIELFMADSGPQRCVKLSGGW